MSEGAISSSDPAPGRASWFAGGRALAIAGGVALAAGGLLSCGDSSTEPGSPSPPPPPPPVATTVAVTPAAAELSAIGETVQLSAEVRDQGGRVMAGAAVTWTSSDPAVVSVSASGVATAAGNGTATVTATSGSASGTATVTVEQSVTAVAITPDSALVLVGDTLRLSAAAVDALGVTVEGAAVAWASGDTLVATVDPGGLATGIATGAVEITATSSSVVGRARVVVAVAAPTMVAVTPDSVSLMALGDTVRLSAEVLDQAGRPMPGAAVAWSSADPAVVSVDSTGLVRAEGSGATTVMATAGSASGSASVSVTQSASSVMVTPPEASIGPGDTLRLAAQALDANGHPVVGAEFSWSSSDESVATVDGSGLVRGTAAGATTITAAAGHLHGTSEITVANPDRAALVAFYEATDGPNWRNNENWLTDAPLDEWYGVDTDQSGRVVSLDLSGESQGSGEHLRHGLQGPIPPEIGSLRKLRRIDFRLNQLTEIPSEMGRLTNLSFLRIDDNFLSGPIPPEIGHLTNLEHLDLSANFLSGPIPPELSGLATLWTLVLHSNRLSGPIPPELRELRSLGTLHLFRNRLSGPIPPELSGLTSLRRLHLRDNPLTGPIPPELGHLANLEALYLDDTHLTGAVPQSLLDLELRGFSWGCGSTDCDLGDLCAPGTTAFVAWVDDMEHYEGPFCNASDQAALGSLFHATRGDEWTESTGWLGGSALAEWHGVSADSLGHVTALRLSDNGLRGKLPAALSSLPTLTNIRVDGNALAGRLPLSLTRLRLEEFHYGGTNICEPADDDFQAWLAGIASHAGTGIECEPLTDRDALTALYTATGGPNWRNNENWLTDAPLGTWDGVRTDDSGRVVLLQLNYNDLTGAIPPELGELSELVELWLDGNGLTGAIPPQFGDLAKLEVLNLANNNLGGVIPSELGRLSDLRIFFLYRNNLTGAIPSELGDLSNLEDLRLGVNPLTGPIPSKLGNLANLEWLYLGESDLTGPIPPELGDLPNLKQLWLEENDLSGPIPPELGELGQLETLQLGRNELSGALPPQLGGLTSLKDLNVSGNRRLSGAVPASMTGIGFESLSLGSTDLCVPREPRFLDWLATIARKRIAFCGGGETAAYLTQAVQSRTHPVPLVAGEQALLRVFVTAIGATTEELPPVRARFYVDGIERHVAGISAKSTPIPEEVDEGDLSKSQNAEIPAEVVQPGLEMVVEVDPDRTLDAGLGVTRRIPEEGRLALDVRRMPIFHLTVIPFLAPVRPDSAVLDAAEGMAADPGGHELLEDTHVLLPVGELNVTAHAPVVSTSNDTWDLAGQIGAIRRIEGDRGHHVGLVGEGFDGPAYGWIGGRISVSWLNPVTLAHELGHNMHLYHAPCGDAGGPDPSFPYRDGSVGVWGYDFRAGSLVSPFFADVMSYCGPHWISDYHFSNALGYRLLDEGGAASSVAAAPTRSLLVWGGIDPDGEAFLNPAFVVDAPVALPDSAGAYSVTGRDAGGGALFSLSFAMPVLAGAEGASSFVFAVPAEAAWEGRLASVTLSGPAGEVVLDGETNRPMAILRDPASGQVRGFFSELSQDVGTAAAAAAAIDAEPGLRVLFSRGIPDAAVWHR